MTTINTVKEKDLIILIITTKKCVDIIREISDDEIITIDFHSNSA